MKGLYELDEMENASDESNLLIVDALNFAFRYKHKGTRDFTADYIRTVRSLARSYNAKDIIITCDHRHSAYRRAISSDYKQNRKAQYENQTEEEKAAAAAFFEEFDRTIEICKTQFPTLRFEFVEADDLGAYLVKALSPHYDNIWLVSSDKDWDLLLKDNVRRFSFVTRKEYTLDNFYEYHDCDSPEQYISIKVFHGDSGDGIEGLSGWGPKRTYNLLREHGTALDVYSSIPLPGKSVLIDRLNKSGDLILKNYELMDLLSFCEDAIAYPNPENLKEIEEFCEQFKHGG